METIAIKKKNAGNNILRKKKTNFFVGHNNSHQHFEQLLKQMSVAYFTSDQFGYITFFNDCARDLWGIEPTIGEDFWYWAWKIFDMKGNFVLPENSSIAACLAERKSVPVESLMIERQDGLRHLVEVRPQPMFNKQGSFIGTSILVINITDSISFNPIYNIQKDEIIGVACASGNITELRDKEKLFLEQNKVASKKETNLQKLSDELEKIMNSSLDVICTIDGRGRFTRVSAASKKLWGYAPEELIGRECINIVSPSQTKATIEAAQRVRAGIEMTHFENVFIKKSGLPVYLVWSAKWDSEAKTMFCIAKDITGIKEVDRQKYEAEQKFSTLIQKGADMVAILDRDGNYKYLSNNIERILGYKSEELLGRSSFDFIHPDDVAKMSNALEALLYCSEVEIADFRFKDGFGKWIWIEVIGSNMLDNEMIKGIVINSRDVTERKLQEQELRNSNERFEIVSKATNEAIWDYDVLTGDLYWNENYSTLFGYEKASNNLESWKQNIHPEDLDETWNSFQKLVNGTNDRYWKGEYRYRKTDGNFAHIFDQGYLLSDENGKTIRIVGAMQDISGRKEIENEKELIIEELTTSNNDLKQFSFITSHNLRAPLSNIQGILNLIDKNDLNDTNKKMFGLLKDSSAQLQETIKDLTDIIVIRETAAVSKHEINLMTIFNNVKNNFLNTFHQIPHELRSDFQVETAYLNKSYLESIFINLLSNAIKYRGNDRTLILDVSTTQSTTGDLVIKFRDNGIGLDLIKCKNRMFGMYQRFHENVEGRGLGLFMVKAQVTSMGGTIDLESDLNKGTEFTIKLPMKMLKDKTVNGN